jgi:hypothetical protein
MTLDIDDDVLVAVKELAAAQGLTAGRLASNMLRGVLTGRTPAKGGQPTPTGFSEEQQAAVRGRYSGALFGCLTISGRHGHNFLGVALLLTCKEARISGFTRARAQRIATFHSARR